MGTCFGAVTSAGWYPAVMGATLLRVTHRGFEGDETPIWLADLGVILLYGTPYKSLIAIERVPRMSLLLHLVEVNRVWVSLSPEE